MPSRQAETFDAANALILRKADLRSMQGAPAIDHDLAAHTTMRGERMVGAVL